MVDRCLVMNGNTVANVILGDAQALGLPIAPNDQVSKNWVYDGANYNAPVAVTPAPRPLSKTAFMDHCVAQFIAVNGGDIGDGYERFDEVMEAARTSTQGKVRAAYKRYDAADTFSKDTTDVLTQWMVDSTDTGKLTSTERTAVLDNWPT